MEIVVPRGFDKMKQVASEGGADFVYANSLMGYRLKQGGFATPIAQMYNIDDKTVSRGKFFVHRDSGITTISQLRGKRIAFVSPLGDGAYLAPRAFLYKNGISTQEYITEVFTGNLSNSLHQVLLKETDAGAMCGVNYRLLSEKLALGELNIIAETDEFAETVIAATKGIDPDLVRRFKQAVLGMHETEAGKRILAGMRDLKIQRFVPYDERIEDITRKLLREAKLEP